MASTTTCCLAGSTSSDLKLSAKIVAVGYEDSDEEATIYGLVDLFSLRCGESNALHTTLAPTVSDDEGQRGCDIPNKYDVHFALLPSFAPCDSSPLSSSSSLVIWY